MSPAVNVTLPRVLALVAGMLVAAAVPAQVNDDANAGIQFSFGTPGARSLAMGGAFVGLADDPSAAYANPAGLTALEGSHLDVALSEVKYTHLFTSTGHYAGPPSFYGEDNIQGLVFDTESNHDKHVGFLSYAYGGERWAVAAFRHIPGAMTAEFKTRGSWVGEYSFDPDVSTVDRLYPAMVELDLEATTYGLAVAFNLTDTVTVGVTATYWEMALDSTTRSLYFSHDTSPPPPGEDPMPTTFYGPPSRGDAEDVFSYQYQRVDDDDVAFNLGLLWRPSDRFQVGATYRKGTEYELTYLRTCGAARPEQGEPTCSPASDAGTFAIPTVYGVGVALRPLEGLTVTMDVNRVEYSAMAKEVAGPPEYAAERRSFAVENGTEFRLGAEYAFTNLRNPFFVRGGLWLDPAHQMGYRGSSNDPLLLALWQAELANEDEGHLTGGVGWLLNKRFTVDLGFDLSDRLDTFTVAAGYRF